MKPTSIILDLLRTYGTRGTSVQDLANTGALFGFSENRIRVSLSRLVARGVIENIHRGHYRLCDTTDPINAFAERWRLGEARVSDWHGDWICVHLPGKSKKAEWSLANFGFAPLAPLFWVRPGNLNMSDDELRVELRALGMPSEAILAGAASLEPHVRDYWQDTFKPSELEKRYKDMNQKLQDSLVRLPSLDQALAKKESFDLGGQGIQLLAKDPLLPSEMMNTAARAALWQTMCRFDEVGRQIWAGHQRPDVTPTSQTDFTKTEIAL